MGRPEVLVVTMAPGRRCGGDAIEQLALDFEIFGDGFDDPIGFGAPGEIVFEIADGDARGDRGREEGGGAGLEGGVQAGADDAVADAGIGEREAAGFFLGRELGRDDIQQPAGHAGVGQMRGDARAHGAGAEDGNFFDAFALVHSERISSPEIPVMAGTVRALRKGYRSGQGRVNRGR